MRVNTLSRFSKREPPPHSRPCDTVIVQLSTLNRGQRCRALRRIISVNHLLGDITVYVYRSVFRLSSMVLRGKRKEIPIFRGRFNRKIDLIHSYPVLIRAKPLKFREQTSKYAKDGRREGKYVESNFGRRGIYLLEIEVSRTCFLPADLLSGRKYFAYCCSRCEIGNVPPLKRH